MLQTVKIKCPKRVYVEYKRYVRFWSSLPEESKKFLGKPTRGTLMSNFLIEKLGFYCMAAMVVSLAVAPLSMFYEWFVNIAALGTALFASLAMLFLVIRVAREI